MRFKKYFLAFSGTLLLLAVLTTAINRIVDPFWYYRDISINGFNAVKPKFRNYERHVKPAMVQREQPASLIFGSSLAEIGFDPLHPALRMAGKSYNFALAGASWEMVACSMQFALARDAALRKIVLGLHPESMPQVDCKAAIAKMEVPEERAFLFSSDAFQASINTVLEQHKQKPSHTAEGLYFYTRGVPATADRFREFFALDSPCQIGQVSLSPTHPPPPRRQEQLDLSGLHELIRVAVKKGIELKLVMYPRHALSFEREYQCGTRQARWVAIAQIISMVEAEKNSLVEVWDFEGYHAIGTEPISNAPSLNWQDPKHFNTEFGNIMLDEMFAIKPPRFGMHLTSANLLARANTEIQTRRAYLDSHPEFLQQLKSLLPNHGALNR